MAMARSARARAASLREGLVDIVAGAAILCGSARGRGGRVEIALVHGFDDRRDGRFTLLGDLHGIVRPAFFREVGFAAYESSQTTQLSVIDTAGNAVSITYTLNGLWGDGVTVPGAGFLLNNEMDDFTAKVGARNMYGLVQSASNSIAPGKRPLSSMTPTIVVKDGRPFLITGSPGGPTIINTVLLVITNVIDHGLTVTQAVDEPRFHHQWQPDVIGYEPLFASPDSIALLKNEGYHFTLRTLYPNAPESTAHTWGDAETILADPVTGLRLGANDLRSPDSAAVGW
jgi:gamma-glutamyltranspeptidase / glutathione hydrolase